MRSSRGSTVIHAARHRQRSPFPAAAGTARRARRRVATSGGTLLLTSILVLGATPGAALAEPLVRGQSATYDIALVDPTGSEDEFTVIFDAEVAGDGSSVIAGQFGGAQLQVGSGDAALTLEPFAGDGFVPTGFVARFDAGAQAVWAARFPGAAVGVAIDGDGAIGVTGSFDGEAVFDGTTLQASGDADAFLARYQPDGTLDWVVQAGGPTSGFLPFGCQTPRDIGTSVDFGADGELFWSGGVTGASEFSQTSGDPVSVGAADDNVNGFVARYSAAGEIIAVQRIVSTEDSLINGVAAAPGGLAAITGFVRGTGSVGGETLAAASGTDAFVAILDVGGTATWLAPVSGEAAARPESPVCGPGQTTTPDWPTHTGTGVDISGGAVVALTEILGTTTFENPGGEAVVSEGSDADDHDLSVARYDLGTGSLQWVSRGTSTQGMLGGAVLASADGGAVATGYFRSAATFGGLSLTGTGDTTMFVVGFGADAAPTWADAVDTSADGSSVGFGLAQAGDGSVFAVGKVTSSPERAVRVQYTPDTEEEAGVVTGQAEGTTLALACTPESVRVGSEVTCTVTGGEPGIDILWRAAYNTPFAGQGVTLDANGTGTFTFTVPAAALGETVTVELVEWLAPVSLGVVGGPVPSSVPSGGGPVPVWSLVMLVLAGGLALRRMSAVGARG